MSTAREELVRLMSDRFRVGNDDINVSTWEVLADALLAAGWRSPAQVEVALKEQREGIAAALVRRHHQVRSERDACDPFADMWRFYGGVCNGLAEAMAIARTYTQEAAPAVPAKNVERHRGVEPDRVMGGVCCSVCGWHLAGKFTDPEIQGRQHDEYTQEAGK